MERGGRPSKRNREPAFGGPAEALSCRQVRGDPLGWRGLCLALIFPCSAFADPAGVATIAPPAQGHYAVVGHMDNPERRISFSEGKLLVHQRTADPFGIVIRGPFKGLPVIAEHPAAAPTPASQPHQATIPVQAPAAPDEPTLEMAVQQLAVGGLNIAGREVLIGSRSIHEGDLLILELSGSRFLVWVESIDRRGVQFCDADLQRHVLKSFRFGPSELPPEAAGRQPDVHDLLKQFVH